MSKVLACIDGSVYSDSVLDHAAWIAQRLHVPVELLQVLGRREAVSSDRSGRIVAGARRKLLEELAALDAERAKLQQEDAFLAMDEAKAHLVKQGISDVTTTLRHGDLIETMHQRDEDAVALVVGKRGEAADFAALHLGSNLERIVRSTRRPMLIASRAFRPIKRAVIAFDGSASSLKAVDAISRSAVYEGVSFLILMVADPSHQAHQATSRARDQLKAAGLSADVRIEGGRTEEVISAAVKDGIDLLVMGAYGHSVLRNLIIGSTTSALIRRCQVPVAVYR